MIESGLLSYKKYSASKFQNPWFSRKCLLAKKELNKLYKCFKKDMSNSECKQA